jgi:hypothetical protein
MLGQKQDSSGLHPPLCVSRDRIHEIALKPHLASP